MEKRVRRMEASITVGAKGSPAKSPVKEQSTLGFVNANSLAEKYGVAEKAEVVQPPPPVFTASQQRAEVDMLRKLEEKNRKIDQLCVLLEALEPAPGVDPERIQKLMDEGIDENVDFRDSKIVSLAKKSHRLTQQLNKEKSVTDKLNQQVLELQKTVGSLTQELQAVKASSSNRGEPKVYNRNTAAAEGGTSAEDYLVKIAGLNRDVKEGGKQIDELKRKLAQSVDEAKQLSRALAREIGEGVTLEDAVNGGWRGRAQQIIMLKNKIKRLESGDGGAGMNGSTVGSSGYGANASKAGGGSTVAGGASTFTFDVDRKAEEDLQAMSNDRRQIVEALTEERAGLMDANQHLEKRNTAQKARIQNLEGDVRKLKDSLQMVLDKSSTDDQLLDALREEVARLKAQSQQQHNHAGGSSSSGSTFAGRSYADGINSKFNSNSSGAGASAIRSSGQQVLQSVGGRSSSFKGVAADSVMADSLDFLQSQQAQQQESWETEQRQMQAELQRLRRQVKNQAEQLETQDVTIRQLKKKMDTDFRS